MYYAHSFCNAQSLSQANSVSVHDLIGKALLDVPLSLLSFNKRIDSFFVLAETNYLFWLKNFFYYSREFYMTN